ncbi:hypothetical protein [Treponema porcinum]|uniref:hypothetical protein n=1 Tax=Treponema porcinum TaxID=261392 RepID=UPI0023527527|nr:hypothetical protein [Treponema porcinum]MCI6322764.1 hypothetical protein [Treponema porcinum]
MKTMNIPDRILEEIHLGERNAEDYYDIYGKEQLENALKQLDQSDEEILSRYSADDMRNAVLKKQFSVTVGTSGGASGEENGSSEKKSSPYALRLRIMACAAAVLAAVFAAPAVMQRTRPASASPENSVRLKGNKIPSKTPQSLRLYRKDGNSVNALENGASAKAGDVIQITYNPGRNDYGVIFSIDGNGNVTRHFPEDGWIAVKMKHSASEIPLDFSYELDDASYFEYFILVASKKAFSLEGIDEKIAASALDMDFLQEGTYLPLGTDRTVFLLRK